MTKEELLKKNDVNSKRELLAQRRYCFNKAKKFFKYFAETMDPDVFEASRIKQINDAFDDLFDFLKDEWKKA
jgi:hypothetical protein